MNELQRHTMAAHKHQLINILKSISDEYSEFIGDKEISNISKMIPTDSEESSKNGYLYVIDYIESM